MIKMNIKCHWIISCLFSDEKAKYRKGKGAGEENLKRRAGGQECNLHYLKVLMCKRQKDEEIGWR